MVTAPALREDVNEGRAAEIGEEIQKSHAIEPTGIFFEKVARQDPNDSQSPKIGLGRFHAEIWILSWFGIDFTRCSKAQLVATRFFFDALFPFLILFLVSFMTRPVPKEHLDRFFAKLHTPVQKTEAEEKKALAAAYKNPGQFEKDKIFKGTGWEILKPGKRDYIGFGGSWLLVGVILFLLWLITVLK